jgi:hypothetical protein
MRRRLALGILSGQSFDLSCGSLFVEAEKVDVSEVAFNGRRKVMLVDLVNNDISVKGMFAWTRSKKISMESAFTPAPLWQLAWRMVVQMLPRRAYGWEGGGDGGWFSVGTGWV